jgi:asparagine synthase (glutamine-hydrolysing)
MLPRSSAQYYAHYQTQWKQPQRVVIGGWEPGTVLSQFEKWPNVGSFLQQMMFVDMRGYLVDDILVKVDRASMAHSLEVRVPMLDHRLVEFAWTIPDAWKRHPEGSKWLLRKLLSRYVPASMIESGKRGFAVPLGQWLRGPLRDWAESLLSEDLLRRQGYFHADPIRRKWQQHLSGQIDWQYDLWDVLMFQSWLEAADESAA